MKFLVNLFNNKKESITLPLPVEIVDSIGKIFLRDIITGNDIQGGLKNLSSLCLTCKGSYGPASRILNGTVKLDGKWVCLKDRLIIKIDFGYETFCFLKHAKLLKSLNKVVGEKHLKDKFNFIYNRFPLVFCSYFSFGKLGPICRGSIDTVVASNNALEKNQICCAKQNIGKLTGAYNAPIEKWPNFLNNTFKDLSDPGRPVMQETFLTIANLVRDEKVSVCLGWNEDAVASKERNISDWMHLSYLMGSYSTKISEEIMLLYSFCIFLGFLRLFK